MDTDTPADPRGVPHHVARMTLTEPQLIREYRAAQNAPLPVQDLNLRWLLYQQEVARASMFSGDALGQRGPSISKADQAALRAWEAVEAAHRERISRASEALDADLRRLVRDGLIIASAIDPNSPFEPPRHLHPYLAADLQSPDSEPRINGGPVLADLRYRRADPVAAPADLPAKTPRQGPLDPSRLASVLDLARTKITSDTRRQTAVKQAYQELHGRHASQAEVKACMRALQPKPGDRDN